MKLRITYLLIILLSSVRITLAQQIIAGYDLSPQWTVCYYGLEQEPDTVVYRYSNLLTLCGELWQEVEEIKIGESIHVVGYYRETEDGRRGYFRFDTACHAQTYTIYDFGLNIGDTLSYPLGAWYGGEDYVYYQDLLFAGTSNNGESIEYYFFPTSSIESNEEIWVDGIGSSRHPFPILLPCLGPSAACEIDFNICCVSSDTLQRNPCEVFFKRFYVDKDATSGERTGVDWENAFTDLQDALLLAAWGDEIWVAEGDYKPTSTTDRSISFQPANGVRLYGGFMGTETYRDERSIELYPTILSGEIGDSFTMNDNSYNVLSFNDVDSNTLLDGFIIEKGVADTQDNPFGGGISFSSLGWSRCEPTIQNCRITSNSAIYGGGIACLPVGDGLVYPRFRNCDFENNEASSFGGGAYFRSVGVENTATPLFDRCNFIDNNATSEGGGIYIGDVSGNMLISNTVFDRDSSLFNGGGVSITFYGSTLSKVSFIDCEFNRNVSGVGGGLFLTNIYNEQVDTTENLLHLEIIRSEFTNNTASEEGGGIEVYTTGGASQIKLSNCTISGNTLLHSGNGAGVHFLTDADGLGWYDIDRSRFTNNILPIGRAETGKGGLYIEGSFFGARVYSKITNSLFSGNTNGLHLIAGPLGFLRSTVANCTFFDNGVYPITSSWSFDPNTSSNLTSFLNNIVWEPQSTLPIRGGSSGLNGLEISHSIFNTLDCGLSGGLTACLAGNIVGIDPLFLDEQSLDLRTASCSPARDAGTNGLLDSIDLEVDILGNSRLLDESIDIGAFEQEKGFLLIDTFAQAGCPGESIADLIIDTIGAISPLTIEWYNGLSQGTGSEDLPPGDYVFVIEDQLGCLDSFALSIPSTQAITVESELTNATSANAPNGSINISLVNGGTPPYALFWSTLDTSFNLNNLLPGEYELVVTDSEGCIESFEFIVSFLDGVLETSQNSVNLSVIPNVVASGGSAIVSISGLNESLISVALMDELGRQLDSDVVDGCLTNCNYRLQIPAGYTGLLIVLLQDINGKYIASERMIAY